MRQSALLSTYDHWSNPSYEVRVRGTARTYLWGSAGIAIVMAFDKPLVLHLRNHVLGEQITIGTQSGGSTTVLGTLDPGECISIPLHNVSGVYASCVLDTTVACVIRGAA